VTAKIVGVGKCLPSSFRYCHLCF